MTADEVEYVVRRALDWGEARIAAYDLSIKGDAAEVRALAEQIAADLEPEFDLLRLP